MIYEIENEKEFKNIIETDQGRLLQVMLGLQSNAMKFTRVGHVKHILSIVKRFNLETQDRKLFIRDKIQDTGIGIKQED